MPPNPSRPYKVTVDPQEGRKRREDSLVEIRKRQREESLQKKRRDVQTPSQQSVHAGPSGTSVLDNVVEDLEPMITAVHSDNVAIVLYFTTQFRQLLCTVARRPPVEEVIQSGVVPRFVEFLGWDDFPKLQLEAAWILTNITSGTTENTSIVVKHGAVPFLVKLMISPCENVREQALWALGNIAGDSLKHRDEVLKHGAMIPLLAQFNTRASLSMRRNATWALSNFCRGKPQPWLCQTKRTLPILCRLVNSRDEYILADACWALSHLSNGANDRIEFVIEAGVCPRLVELLEHPSPKVVIPALRALGYLVSGDDTQTQTILNYQLLPRLHNLLKFNQPKDIKKEACWTISNITAGTTDQIQGVVAGGIMTKLINLLQYAEYDVKKEASWAISNAISGGSNDQVKYMVNEGCIKPLCDLLVCPSARIISVCLEALEKILKIGETEKKKGNTSVNVYAVMIDDVDGFDKIESLQIHENIKIYEKVVKILQTYWVDEEDDEMDAANFVF